MMLLFALKRVLQMVSRYNTACCGTTAQGIKPYVLTGRARPLAIVDCDQAAAIRGGTLTV